MIMLMINDHVDDGVDDEGDFDGSICTQFAAEMVMIMRIIMIM